MKISSFTIPDWVGVRQSHQDHKLLSFWSTSPVTAQLDPATFHLSVAQEPPSEGSTVCCHGPNIDSGFISDDMDFPAEKPPAPADHTAEPATRRVQAPSWLGYLRENVTDFWDTHMITHRLLTGCVTVWQPWFLSLEVCYITGLG